MVWEIVRRGSMTVDRILFQSEESLLFGISGDGTELSGGREMYQRGRCSLFESMLRLSTYDPILGPFSAVHVSLRIVISNGLFFRDIVAISSKPSLLGCREVRTLLIFLHERWRWGG